MQGRNAIQRSGRTVARRPDWAVITIDCGHNVMVAGRLRVAFGVDDTTVTTDALVDVSARLIAPPTRA